MPRADEFRFKDCRVLLGTREILVGDRAREVRPAVFDLLVYLIENTERVVTSRELLEVLWPDRQRSGNAVARAVMEARLAIGDDAATPVLIRTIRKIGYRFVGELALDGHAANLALASRAGEGVDAVAAKAAVRVALLPVRNHTANPKLAWVELGLPSLALSRLEGAHDWSLVPLASVLRALENRPELDDDANRAHHVARSLDATCVVTASLVLRDGGFALTYQGFGVLGGGLGGILQKPELSVLGLELARAIQEGLSEGKDRPGLIGPSDPFANECFARAMQASQHGKHRTAARLLALSLEADPANQAARLANIRALSEIGDADAVRLARVFLTEMRAKGDLRSEAVGHYALSLAQFLVAREAMESEASIDRALALALATPDSLEDWYSHALTHKARLLYGRSQYDRARAAYLAALKACERTGNQIRIAAIMNNLGAVEYARGNLLGAREMFVDLAALARERGMPATEMSALVNQGFTNAALGLFREAVRSIDTGLGLIRVQKEPERRFKVDATRLVAIPAEMRWVGTTHRFATELGHAFWAAGTPIDRACAQMAAAQAKRAEGALHEALDCMRMALASPAVIEDFQVLEQFLPHCVHVAVQAGCAEEAAGMRERIASFPEYGEAHQLQGEMLHARALQAFREGDLEGAADGLRQALARVSTGLFLGYACLDLAWLHLEMGELAAAEAVLRAVEPWLHQHPAGLVVLARLHYLRDDPGKAIETQGLHCACAGGAPRTRFGHLDEIYGQTRRGSRSPSFPVLRFLPTDYVVGG